MRFVLSRLKCIFKGNRERRCNFPRETEHEIKRPYSCSISSSPPLFLPPCLFPLRCTLAASGSLIRPGLFFPSVALNAPRQVLTIIFPREAHTSSLPLLPPSFRCNLRRLYTMALVCSELSPAPSIKDREECST